MNFIDLQKQYQVMKTEIDQAILGVLDTSNYILGEPVTELEKKLADFLNVKHCISCANGTDALLLPLIAKNIGKGDAVFVPNFTFFATAEVVNLRGATPIFVDVDENTFNINPKKLENAIKEVIKDYKLNPAAVIPVDLFGLPAAHKEISNIANKYGLIIIEDGAQGFGGTINRKKACSFGDVATTSFFPSKPLGCYGDGGAMFTDDDSLADELRSLRRHGECNERKHNHKLVGINSRLDSLQAAVLLVKLDAFQRYELDRRNKLATLYTQKLLDVVKTPIVPKNYFSSWAQYTIKLKNKEQRDYVKTELQERDIPTRVYYEKPLNRQEVYKGKSQFAKTFEKTEKLCCQVLSLPMHPYLTNDEVDSICELIKSFV
ncbi:MAG: DegT/DnrJ/EryC1/StrS family aminotransferase [Oscillospiraceae bacterium]|jgi:dTDP-4-amino-4,6-dideoxygalactose transaminase|nr:DegT/DnrJ/EryC1/StrS family aminotransferase [Oscillospiraceae bacterium]